MISNLREGLLKNEKTRNAITVFCLIVLLVPGLAYFFDSKKNAKNLFARVEKVNISRNYVIERSREMSQLLEECKRYFGPDLFEQFAHQLLGGKSFDLYIYEEVLMRALRINMAQNASLNYLSSRYIEKKLRDREFILQRLSDSVPRSVVDNKGLDNEKLFSYVHTHGGPIESFEDQLEDSFRIVFLDSLMRLFFVPQFKQLVDGNFEIIALPYSLFVLNEKDKEALRATPQALRAFYELQNSEKQLFTIPEIRKVTVWKFNSPVSAELKNEKNKKTVDVNVFKKRFTADIRVLLAGSSSSQSLASFISKNKGIQSAQSFDQGDSSPLARKARGISQVGSLSYIVNDKEAFIVRLEEIIPSRVRSFEESYDDVVNAFVEQEARKNLTEWVDHTRLFYDENKKFPDLTFPSVKITKTTFDELKKNKELAGFLSEISRPGMSFVAWDEKNKICTLYAFKSGATETKKSELIKNNYDQNSNLVQDFLSSALYSMKNYAKIDIYEKM